MAGITDVARTKEESNPEKDKKMNDVAEKGTSVVLSESSENCKIIFPSTHVVFEGKGRKWKKTLKKIIKNFLFYLMGLVKIKMKNK